jgi:hypothetical protein
MLSDILFGTLAGTAGTVALNVVTYADMALRGRPASETPAKVAEKVAAGVGDLAGQDGATQQGQSPSVQHRQTAQQRASGLGALLGYATGLGVGTAYGVLRLGVPSVPVPLAGIVLGATAMAASDVPSIKLDVTDPAEWGTSGWLADIIPQLAYGLVTAAVYEGLARSVRPSSVSLRSFMRG